MGQLLNQVGNLLLVEVECGVLRSFLPPQLPNQALTAPSAMLVPMKSLCSDNLHCLPCYMLLMSFSVDENLSNISLDVLGLPNETDKNKPTREKKNKQNQALRNCARHRKEEMERYQSTCREVERKCLEDEAAHQQCLEDKTRNREHGEHEGVLASASRNLEADFMEVAWHTVYNTPYANIFPLATELASIQNPTEEQQHLKVILQSAALQLNGRNLASIANPSQGGSSRPEQRRSVHEWLGERASQHRSIRDNRPANPVPGDLRHRLNRQEGGAQSEYGEQTS